MLHSTERPGLTPVFGTAVPPSGPSGKIRRAAFRHGEGRMRHWMLLLMAHRVNVVEGIVHDVSKSRRTHSLAVVGAAAVLAAWWLSRR